MNNKTPAEMVTDEQRKKYQQVRDDFVKNRNAKRILIQNKREVIRTLEQSIKNERPKIEGCDPSILCKRCDIYSMMEDGFHQEQDFRVYHYKCVICSEPDYRT